MEKKYTFQKHVDGERSPVMWAWVDRVNPEDIVYQIRKFKEGGIEEFYIHPCWTLEVDDYLSDTYMSLVKLASETAESLGMKYSIYDDYCWASGFCAGKAIEKYPEGRMTMMRRYKHDSQAGEPVEIWFKGKLLAVQVEYCDKQRRREDITDKVRVEIFGNEEGGRIFWDNANCCAAKVWAFCRYYPEAIGAGGKWAPFAQNITGGTDVMNPKAVQTFLEVNNEVFKKELGDKFGTHIRRVFTDETSLASMLDFMIDFDRFPYSDIIEEEFYKEHGYPIREHFIALTEDYETDEDIRVRYDYYQTCCRLFVTSYLDQYADWCHKNGLLLTGHMSGEEELFWHVLQMGDFYEALSRFDVPGVDTILTKLFMNDEDFLYMVKPVISVAKFDNRDHILCETFSGSGWDTTLEDMKRIMNRLLTFGVNYIMYMTAGFSSNECLKAFPVGYPPSHGYNNPLFRHYPTLTDYTAVRSSLLAQTRPGGSALLFLPNADARVHLKESLGKNKLNKCWHDCTLAMQKASVEHDIFFEPLAKETAAENGKLTLRGYTYDTLILPYVRCSDQTSLDMLEKFCRQGGSVVFIDAFPYLAADTGKHYDFASICSLSEAGRSFFKTGEEYAVRREGNVLLIRTGAAKNFVFSRFGEDLCTFVRAQSEPEILEGVDVPTGVYLAQRHGEGLDCCLICNDTDAYQTVTLRVNKNRELTLLEGMKLRPCRAENGAVTIDVAPHDLPVLLLTAPGVTVDGLPFEAAPVVPDGEQVQLTLEKNWHFQTHSHNVLPLKMKYLTQKEPNGILEEEILKLAQTAEVPYASQEFPAGEGLHFGCGYAAFARFEIKELPKYWELFSEVTGDGEVWINGRRVTGFVPVREIGVRDSVAEITALVHTGVNTVVIVNRMPAWKGPHQIPTLLVRGSFRLSGNVIDTWSDAIEPDMYTAQGWRYYGGDSSYHTDFVLDKLPARISVSFETKDTVEVIVNGKSAGICYWMPYQTDITPYCRQGENHLELRFTTPLHPTFVIEEVELVSQGVMIYHDEAPVQTAGLLSVPKLDVKY